MKKIIASVAAIALAVALGGTAMAQGRGGCGNCSQGCEGMAAQTDQFRKFQAETLDLRQEMMNKRFEMQRENLKGNPDTVRIEALKADISQLQAKISQVRVQNGLPEKGKRDGECFKMNWECNKPGSMAGCNGPCGQKQ